MKNLLIVDGYNVIHAWPELKVFLRKSLENARDELVKHLIALQDAKSWQVQVIFDGQGFKGDAPKEQKVHGVFVCFSKAGKTADTLIEGMISSEIAKGRIVRVATSDRQVALLCEGLGALRMSAEALRLECQQQAKELREEIDWNNRQNDL